MFKTFLVFFIFNFFLTQSNTIAQTDQEYKQSLLEMYFYEKDMLQPKKIFWKELEATKLEEKDEICKAIANRLFSSGNFDGCAWFVIHLMHETSVEYGIKIALLLLEMAEQKEQEAGLFIIQVILKAKEQLSIQNNKLITSSIIKFNIANEKNPYLKIKGILLFSQIGEDAFEALPFLERGLLSKNSEVRDASAISLSYIKKNKSSLFSTISNLVEQGEANPLFREGVNSLYNFVKEPELAEKINSLISTLLKKENFKKQSNVFLLLDVLVIGTLTRESMIPPVVYEMLEHPDEGVRWKMLDYVRSRKLNSIIVVENLFQVFKKERNIQIKLKMLEVLNFFQKTSPKKIINFFSDVAENEQEEKSVRKKAEEFFLKEKQK